MRSLSSEQRIPVTSPMPGRYKSCRRSISEIFTKEQEQELQQAAQSEVFMKVEQEKEPESPVKMTEVSPPKLTPLRWRSTSVKERTMSPEIGADSVIRPAEEPIQIQPVSNQPVQEVRRSQSVQRPSQAQLRAKVMNSLSLEKAASIQAADNIQPVEKADHAQLVEPEQPPSLPNGKEGEHLPKQEESPPNSAAKPVKRANGVERKELFPDNPVNQKEGIVNGGKPEVKKVGAPERRELFPDKPANQKEGIVNGGKAEEKKVAAAPEKRRDVVSENGSNGVLKKSEKPVPPLLAQPAEDIIFMPVDLDKKYREKELVRHVTAAKIQNREEAILNNPKSPGLNGRKVPVGEEPTTMTIEFLRARLQAERSASKATKLRMEQLSKRVVELESSLLAEIDVRKSAETALQDALLKLKQAVPPADKAIQQAAPNPTSGLQKASSAGEMKMSQKTVSRPEVETVSRPEVETVSRPAVETAAAGFVEPKSVSPGENAVEVKLPVKEEVGPVGQESGSSSAGAGDKASLSTTQDSSAVDAVTEGGGLWRDRSVSVHPSGQDPVPPVQPVSVDGEGTESAAAKVPQAQASDSGSSPESALSPSQQKRNKRAVIEERLRSMWAKIGEEMAALADVQGEGELTKKDVMGWMGQLPTPLQDKQSSGDLGAENTQQLDSSDGPQSASIQQTEEAQANANDKQYDVLKEAIAAAERRRNFKRSASLTKNVAKLVEQYEYQETAQREWEENFEAHQSLEKNEGELPALVTRDGDVVAAENESGPRAKGGIARSQSQGERNLNVHGGPLSRSKSMGFLPSQQGMSGSISRKSSSNGRIEILEDNPIEESGVAEEELLFDPETEVAEELPNGIYLHHSRDEMDSYRRGAKDAMYRKGSDRVSGSSDINSPSRSDRARRSRERFPRPADLHGEVDQQGWPVREVQDRASRDMYYEPIINNRGVRVPDDMYRSGQHREAPGMDRVQRQEDRRAPEAPGMPYGYHDRDHQEQDVPYRSATYRHREDGHRGMPAWQESRDPGLRSRGMSHHPYGYPPPYGMEEPQHAQYAQPGLYADAAGYSSRQEMPYKSHGAHKSRPEYYSSPGRMPGPRPPMNGYMPPTERPPATQGYPSWDGAGVHEEQNAAGGGVSEDVSQAGEATEVLKALRIAKQQIKSSTVEQAGFMTAQYTVSQEHRYGAGGQVSKTSYTVEAPVGYPRVMKTVHEGWHLEGGGKSSSKKRGGFNGSNGVAIDLTGTNVTDLINGAGPLTVTNAESSYVEKLNVGRGIQFFFSG